MDDEGQINVMDKELDKDPKKGECNIFTISYQSNPLYDYLSQ